MSISNTRLTELKQAVFEEAPDGILIVDGSGRIVASNSELNEMLGYEASELPGRSIDSLVPQRWRGRHSNHVASFFRRPSVREMSIARDLSARCKDGTELAVEVRLGHYQHDEETFAIAHVRDVTTRRTLERELRNARKAAEEALEQLVATQDELIRSERHSSIGRLVAGISHEINTPVGVALTGASHLVESSVGFREKIHTGKLRKSDLERFLQTVDEASQVIESNLHRASLLIGSFKKVAVDQSAANVRKFELRALVEDVLRSLGPELKRTKIELRIEDGEPIEMHSEPGAIAQVLTNLVQNTIRHAYPENRSGVVTVRMEAKDDMVLLSVKDDGVGMPQEILSKVFQAFFSTRLGHGGSGLGLNICENLVQQVLKGSINVRSEVDKGTTFDLALPVYIPATGETL